MLGKFAIDQFAQIYMADSMDRTSSPNITWVPQVLSSALLGGGCMVAFWQGMNYIIDCYGFYSNSAIAVNTFIRSIAGAAFVRLVRSRPAV